MDDEERKSWERGMDDTLDRIEKQSDDSIKQEGFALNFREKVLTSLTKIEGALDQNEKDHTVIKKGVSKILPMEISLENHLAHHDKYQKLILYPFMFLVIAGFAGLVWQIIIHVIKTV